MKRILVFVLVISTHFVSGCSMMQMNKDEMVSDVHTTVSESICSDPKYRGCTSSETYSQCLNEVMVYKSVCSTKSFTDVNYIISTKEDREIAAAGAVKYSKCLLNMHIVDKKVADKGGECPGLIQVVKDMD